MTFYCLSKTCLFDSYKTKTISNFVLPHSSNSSIYEYFSSNSQIEIDR